MSFLSPKQPKDPNTICLICKTPFYCVQSVLRKGNGRYCSKVCKGIAQNRPPNAICLICKIPFFCANKRLKTGKYCSWPCYVISKNKPKPVIICQGCGKSFSAKQHKNLIRKFCSRKCMDLWRTRTTAQRSKKNCHVCKRVKNLNQFHKKKSSVDRHSSMCKRCSRKWTRTHPDQVRASSFKTGHNRRARLRGAPSEDITLDEIYLRDSGVCQICHRKTLPPHKGKRHDPKRAALDHIVPVSHPDFVKVGHVRTNVRLVHFGCNSSRNNRPGDAQYLLFG